MINNSITDDYCSFEVCKLLKEKGFNVRSEYYHGDIKSIVIAFDNYNTDTKSGPHYSKPTRALVINWIWENFDIWISINRGFDVSDVEQTGNNMGLEINKTFNNTITVLKDNSIESSDYFNSPQEAAEVALLYCLTNLI